MTFKERLNMCLNEMLAFRSATGYATDTIRHYILNFIVFCTEQFPDAERITQEMIDEWISLSLFSVKIFYILCFTPFFFTL